MAKVKKLLIDQFPHPNDLRNEGKVKMLRSKFSKVFGYAYWCMMLEILSESSTLEWHFTEINCEIFAEELGLEVPIVKAMIEYSISIELLEEDNINVLTCPSLNEKLKYKKNREIEVKQPAEKFVPPIMEVVAAYFKEKNNSTDLAAMDFAEQFWNHYNSKGWVVGKTPMRSWQSAVNGTWKPTGIKSMAKYPNPSVIEMPKRKYLNV